MSPLSPRSDGEPLPASDSPPADVLGRGPAARDFEERLRRVAGSDATVVLEGEGGSGKDAAARRLHAHSARAEGPLVEVDLAALTPSLMEAELFGHEAGAFTGADRARLGRFRRAEGGTLVLGGVELLPESLQVKLLRVLQERVVEPLGAEESLPIDVRVVATSLLDLAARVRAKRFREDLYYRLAVVVLRVPPLRARLDDLPELAEHFVRRAARRTGVPPRALTPEALARLATHPWPGNLRELENALERVLILAEDRRQPGPVQAEELDFLDEAVEGEAARLAREALASGITAAELEGALIAEALRSTRGNASAAARRLGITRRALEYRRDHVHGETGGEEDGDDESDGDPDDDNDDASVAKLGRPRGGAAEDPA